MEGLQLIRVEFDSLENHSPEYENVEQVFISETGGKNAYIKCADYLSNLLIMPYLGYNGTVYPIFKTKKIEIK